MQQVLREEERFQMSEGRITLYIAGDSTAQTYGWEQFPQNGWGQVLGLFLDADHITVSNHAAGGRSSKSFILEGRLEKILGEIQPGDYLFIQFGHNDQKNGTEEDRATRFTDPSPNAPEEVSYRRYLSFYIKGAREKGAIPLLLTSVVRRRFRDGSFLGVEDMGHYPQAMREVAGDLKVPLIDMNEKTAHLVKALGDEPSKALYVHIRPDDPRYSEDPRFEKSDYNTGELREDNSHFNIEGAYQVARLVAEGIMEQKLPIAEFVTLPD